MVKKESTEFVLIYISVACHDRHFFFSAEKKSKNSTLKTFDG